MESYEALLGTLALTMGASWASGINLYAALLVLGLAGSTGNLDLPPDLEVLQDPMVIGAAGLMYFVEFFVDKTLGSIPAGIPFTPLFAFPPVPCWLLALLATSPRLWK